MDASEFGFNKKYMNISSSFVSVQEINTAERHVCLTRDVQTSLSLSMATAVSKVTAVRLDPCSSSLLYFGMFSWLEVVMFCLFFIPGEDANCQRQQQIVGARASRSPSPSQGSHTGVREKENRHQRG